MARAGWLSWATACRRRRAALPGPVGPDRGWSLAQGAVAMIGALSNSLAIAKRTASVARSAMEDHTRQLATGQRVAGAKDDGAAWARAVALRSEAVTQRGKADLLSNGIAMNAPLVEVAEAAVRTTDEFISIIMQAMTQPASGPARQSLAAAWANAVASGDTMMQIGIAARSSDGVAWPADVTTANGTYFRPFSGHTDLEGVLIRRSGWNFTTAFAHWQTDILSGSQAALEARLTTMQTNRANFSSAASENGNTDAQMQRMRTGYGDRADRLEGAAASLTDADLGWASAGLRMAQARQQLALDTISRAISAYTGFAGGLLGNVQRTQRGVLA